MNAAPFVAMKKMRFSGAFLLLIVAAPTSLLLMVDAKFVESDAAPPDADSPPVRSLNGRVINDSRPRASTRTRTTGRGGYNPDRVIVRYKNDMGRLETENSASMVHHRLLPDRAVAATMSPDRIAALRINPNIESIEVDAPRYTLMHDMKTVAMNHYLRGGGTHDYDANHSSNSGKGNQTAEEYYYYFDGTTDEQQQRRLTQATMWGLDLIQARDIQQNPNHKKRICIVDSGYAIAHEDLPNSAEGVNWVDQNGNYLSYWNQDQCGHGTHVAGVVGAIDNNVGVVGVIGGPDPNDADMYVVKVFGDDCGWSYASDIIHAMELCTDPDYGNAAVVSLSLGCGAENEAECSSIEEKIALELRSKDVIFVAAAGNDQMDWMTFPASYDSVISVTAVDKNRKVAGFSNFNSQVELAAPGVDILSTYKGFFAQFLAKGQPFSTKAIELAPHGDVTGTLKDCGLGISKCPPDVQGNICLIERGLVPFFDKIVNCQKAGGKAAVIYNNNDGGNFDGTLGEGNSVNIPAVSLSRQDGQYVKSTSLGKSAKVTVASGLGYNSLSGSSMATPHVSAVAALIWSRHHLCTATEIRKALQMSAKDEGPKGRDDYFGYGIVQAKDADDYLTSNGCAADPPKATTSATTSTTAATTSTTTTTTTTTTTRASRSPSIAVDTLEIDVAKVVSAGIDETLEFTLDVSSQDISCSISGGTGDADLYTRWDTNVDFDNKKSNTCVPWLHGNEETCSSTDLGKIGTTLHIGLFGYRGFSDVSIICSTKMTQPTSIPPSQIIDLDGSWTKIQANKGERLDFRCAVPNKAKDMIAKVRNRKGTPSKGNLDLYASFDRQNVLLGGKDVNDCVKLNTKRKASCRGFGKLGDMLYITVYAVTDFKGVEIRCGSRM